MRACACMLQALPAGGAWLFLRVCVCVWLVCLDLWHSGSLCYWLCVPTALGGRSCQGRFFFLHVLGGPWALSGSAVLAVRRVFNGCHTPLLVSLMAAHFSASCCLLSFWGVTACLGRSMRLCGVHFRVRLSDEALPRGCWVEGHSWTGGSGMPCPNPCLAMLHACGPWGICEPFLPSMLPLRVCVCVALVPLMPVGPLPVVLWGWRRPHLAPVFTSGCLAVCMWVCYIGSCHSLRLSQHVVSFGLSPLVLPPCCSNLMWAQ